MPEDTCNNRFITNNPRHSTVESSGDYTEVNILI